MQRERPDPLKEIALPLLTWYYKEKRELPWRSIPTPYRVWVSEIMLQQTRVAAVLSYFERFMQALPTVDALAAAPEETLFKLWEGLGYYNRARNLQKAACIIMEHHNGELPNRYEDLLALPGIGPYTAGAIASIAFGLAYPAVDGNVLRVASRLLADTREIGSIQKELTARIAAVIPQDTPGDYNQAWMELGAVICLPNGVPLCKNCPLLIHCTAEPKNDAMVYPVKAKKKPRKKELLSVYFLTCQGKIALRKRTTKGVLHNLWEIPNAVSEESIFDSLLQWDIHTGQVEPLGRFSHLFTHIEWQMEAFYVEADVCASDFLWVSPEEIRLQYALPSAFRAVYQAGVHRMQGPSSSP